MKVHRRRTIPGLIFLLMTLAVQAGCQPTYRMNTGGVGILPRAPSGEIPFSNYRPRNPFKQFAPGLLARISYRTENRDLYRAEVWDLLVGPGQKTETVSLPGAVVFEIRSGSGVISVGGKAQDMRIGSVFSLDEGTKFHIENGKPDQAIQIRVYLFTTR